MKIGSAARCAAAGVMVCVCVESGLAQQAIFTPAPTMPSAGRMTTRTLFSFEKFGSDPTEARRDGHELRFDHEFVLGLTGDISIGLNVPVRSRTLRASDGDDRSFGLGDAELTLKYRVWQDDFGPVDTARLSLFGGTSLPTGNGGFGKDTLDPLIGATFMLIHGRHGFNQSVSWTFTTGKADERLFAGDGLSDVLRLDSAYLYRLSPEEYTAETTASTYAVVELNTVYETDGETQMFISPGILYEARRFALEAGVQIPVWQDLDRRPESRYGVTFGMRFLF